MPNPYHQFVDTLERLVHNGRDLPLGEFPAAVRPDPGAASPRLLIFSPHPDDEVVIGGIALRLMRESGWRVINVAVTLGSNPSRQTERLAELKRCCDCIGFELLTTGPQGLERIQPRTREDDPDHWQHAVQIVADILDNQRPEVICLPHDSDWNTTHVGVHHLVRDAMAFLGDSFSCLTIETEFWGAMADPNLMLELSAEQLGDLITALTFHVGEVRRNPYHLTLPAWMIDNVRRGSELVGGQGGGAPEFTFATLYRARHWIAGTWQPLWSGGRWLDKSTPAGQLFPNA